jgi:predicted amidohydrolase
MRPGSVLAESAAAARASSADLLVLPRPPQRPPEASDGPLAHAMGALAESHGQALCYAYREACSGQVHQSFQLVQADGRATANYRCTHLSAAAIAAGLTPGNWLTMARLEPSGVREAQAAGQPRSTEASPVLGLLGGIDHLAPEVARALSALGAALLIAVVDADERCAPDLLVSLARLRAIENGVPVLIIDPSGMVRAAAASGAPVDVVEQGGLTLATLSIGMPATGAAPPAMPRRPDLYGQLTRAGQP